MEQINPVIRADYPDPDIIRVGDTYYMISTTMHFFPGAPILRSYDLTHWEIACYVFDKLDSTSQQQLIGEANIYGKGMWAASLRHNNGTFYVVFSAYDTGHTYLFTTKDINGEWEFKEVPGVYHHNSILFDDDGKVYFVHGSGRIWITEMRSDLSDKQEGGFERLIIKDEEDTYLAYEGSHVIKRNGKYYIFVNHWPKAGYARRTHCCFVSDSLEGEFVGKAVFDDDIGFYNQGVSQGGLVDTPDGKWFAMLYQDRDAAGRMPILVPVKWVDDMPVFGEEGKFTDMPQITDNRPGYKYDPLYTSDDFEYTKNVSIKEMKKPWQWNHEPDMSLISFKEQGGMTMKTAKICSNISQAKNTLTQRMMWPVSTAEVTLDFSEINNGDYAGISAFQGCYGFIGITKDIGKNYIVFVHRMNEAMKLKRIGADYMPGIVKLKLPVDEHITQIELRIKADFARRHDRAIFYYRIPGETKWTEIGDRELVFMLDHFTGCRYGLFYYSTKETGGNVSFNKFIYNYPPLK